MKKTVEKIVKKARRLTVKSLLTLIAAGELLLLLVVVAEAAAAVVIVVDEGSESELTVLETLLLFLWVEGVDVEETLRTTYTVCIRPIKKQNCFGRGTISCCDEQR